MSTDQKPRELPLPPFTYLYMQDQSKGTIRVCSGPQTVNQTAQEQPVVYEHKRGFLPVAMLSQAVRNYAIAVEGSYLQLLNPAKGDGLGGQHPTDGSTSASAPDLHIGRRVNIPGPVCFPLYPGQVARSIRGHRLSSNQYLRARVYDADAANKYWDQAAIAMRGIEGSDDKGTSGHVTEGKGSGGNVTDGKGTHGSIGFKKPASLVNGQILIIKGTDVAFYMPPTGIVVEECNDDGTCQYVRDALTLERLEYCILLSENGNKRYERGPQVVFPEPTETFFTKSDQLKHPAIELNEIQGIHIKVTAPYTDGGREYKEGEEIFVTGKTTPIYFPREEHAIIRYDGKSKHFATSVPKGTARYILHRQTGEISMAVGPAMLLPDPRTEVIVRRALTDKECEMWYPGNFEALEFNRMLRSVADRSPTTRAGAVSEGDLRRATDKGATRGLRGNQEMLLASTQSYTSSQLFSNNAVMESSRVSGDQDAVLDEITRSATYTAPRTITLDVKYQGVPQITIWTGYSIMVTDSSNKRRVVHGPAKVLLEYDETLEILELSTGKPKNTDNLLRTPFLKTEGNRVGDVVEVETSDHVRVQLKFNLLVNFEGDPNKWFNQANYIKMLCDHVRSHLKGHLRTVSIEQFYNNSTPVIRDLILGKKNEGNPRQGMKFESNGARIVDIDVLGVEILDVKVREQLASAQLEAVTQSLRLAKLERDLDVTRKSEKILVEQETAKSEGAAQRDVLKQRDAIRQMEMLLMDIAHKMKTMDEQTKLDLFADEHKSELTKRELQRMLMASMQRLDLLAKEESIAIARSKEEADLLVKRMASISGPLAESLVALSNQDVLVKMATAWSMQEFVGGKNFTDALNKVFVGTPLEGAVKKIAGMVGNNGNGKPLPAST
jgi:major vault protein